MKLVTVKEGNFNTAYWVPENADDSKASEQGIQAMPIDFSEFDFNKVLQESNEAILKRLQKQTTPSQDTSKQLVVTIISQLVGREVNRIFKGV